MSQGWLGDQKVCSLINSIVYRKYKKIENLMQIEVMICPVCVATYLSVKVTLAEVSASMAIQLVFIYAPTCHQKHWILHLEPE